MNRDSFLALFKDVKFDPSYFAELIREREASRVHFKGYGERGPVNKKTDLSSVDEFEWLFGSIRHQLELPKSVGFNTPAFRHGFFF